ncbi:RagB/SusD family nutrient uptake outer membrane protein [Ravibacter arvi]|uniref:RagB/SusD family nutrient uptake outer membrane protein n=1 Tax=Ravibacter arvi TaxID=2051041 RepID=A0ABP8M9W7_9BACT
MRKYKNICLRGLLLAGLALVLPGCSETWLDEQPLAQLSETSFWKSEKDAMLALTGIYRGGNVGNNGYNNELLIMAGATDDSGYKHGNVGVIYSGYLNPGDGQVVQSIWQRAYTTIFKVNYFLENVNKVAGADAAKIAQFSAEARFLRAYEYFMMSVLYGGVPLVTKVLTVAEANTQTRNTYDEVVNFCLTELTEAAKGLPATRPDSERGRILKAAALAVKGRLQMINKKWADAAVTYKEAIDLNAHVIDPRFKELFEEQGETSKEIVLATNCVAGLYGNPQNQLNYHPEVFGGYQEDNAFQGLVDAFTMKDGLPIEESPLYNAKKPFENRDPRLYATLFLPGYTVFRGKSYTGREANLIGNTGYGWKKYVTENYTGAQNSSGDDIIHIRYAEILLSYLESVLEAGQPITQALLDQTINAVRGRNAVKMPPITETNVAKLRELVRRERRVEFAVERLIRYMDIRRWGIYMEVMNTKFYGMKLTDDPDNYTEFKVEKVGKYRGHYIPIDKTGTIKPEMALLPIPLYEININNKIIQNPGYN